ncbi:MAG: hypothetical protein RI885_2547 [Actinomycetota bacterium]|jgi:peptidoglycan/LPS O-acetylase OafA/YrhL
MSTASDSMTAVDRATTTLGAASIAFACFVFAASLPSEFEFVEVGPVGAVALVVCGMLATLSGLTRRPPLRTVAGAVLTAGALAQLVGLAVSVQPLGGDASAMSVTGGLGLALLTLTTSSAASLHQKHPMKGRP